MFVMLLCTFEICNWRVMRALTAELDGKFGLLRMAICGVYTYLLYIYIPQSTWKILRTRHDFVVWKSSRKLSLVQKNRIMLTAGLEMVVSVE